MSSRTYDPSIKKRFDEGQRKKVQAFKKFLSTEPTITKSDNTNRDDYHTKIKDITQNYYKQNFSVEDILLRTALITQDNWDKLRNNGDEQSQNLLQLAKLFKLTKTRADEKLQTSINDLKIDNIDKQLSDLIELCSAHTSLKLGVPEFVLKNNDEDEVKLGSFNYSGKGASPQSKIKIRDARLQDVIEDTFPVPAEIADTHIAIMAGRVRGAIAMINNSKFDKNEKDHKKEFCVNLLQVFFDDIKQDDSENFTKNVENFTKNVENFTKVLVKQLDGITIDKYQLTGKKLDKALTAALHNALLNHQDPAHVISIDPTTTKSDKDNLKVNAFRVTAIADPIPASLREKDYLKIKILKEQQAGLKKIEGNTKYKVLQDFTSRYIEELKSDLPKWYINKSAFEQSMIMKNIDNILSGNYILSSQNKNVAGVANYSAEVGGILIQDNEECIIVGGIVSQNNAIESIMLTKGTWAAREKSSGQEEIRLARENMKHLSRLAVDKTKEKIKEKTKMHFINFASTSIFKSQEANMHKIMDNVTRKEGIDYQHCGINMFNFFWRHSSLNNLMNTFKEKPLDAFHLNCKSSKDRAGKGLTILINHILFDLIDLIYLIDPIDQIKFISNQIKTYHQEKCAAGNGGCSGSFVAKLSGVFASTVGLPVGSDIHKVSINKNKALGKTNKIQTHEEQTLFYKITKFLGFRKKAEKIKQEEEQKIATIKNRILEKVEKSKIDTIIKTSHKSLLDSNTLKRKSDEQYADIKTKNLKDFQHSFTPLEITTSDQQSSIKKAEKTNIRPKINADRPQEEKLRTIEKDISCTPQEILQTNLMLQQMRKEKEEYEEIQNAQLQFPVEVDLVGYKYL